jgi:uncharacterized iron-regulated membrane protein
MEKFLEQRMKEHFRQSMAWLHTWTGLLAGWVMFFVFVTGTAAFFCDEITRWMQPELPLRVEAQFPPTAEMAERAVDFLARQREPANGWVIEFPTDGRRIGNLGHKGPGLRGYQTALEVWWGAGEEWLDPVTGEVLQRPETRATHGGNTFLELHFALHYVDHGLEIVGIFTMLMFIALMTGLIVHKRIFKDFFTFRPNKGTRSWLDAHHAFGIMALPFVLMIVYSGLALNLGGYMPAPEVAIPDEEKPREFPPPVVRPTIPIAEIIAKAEAILGKGEIGEMVIGRSGEQLHGVYTKGQAPAWKALWYLAGLHYAWFAGANLRWLYFLSGLIGCALIATGLILWTVRRRARHEKETRFPLSRPAGESAPAGAREGAVPTAKPQEDFSVAALRADAPPSPAPSGHPLPPEEGEGKTGFGFRLVERLNVATIAGLPIGIAAYFWANRLLPFTMADRAEWEIHTLFFVWGWLALYALLRPVERAWTELFTLAAAAFALLPVLNALTTDKHLFATMAHGDWALAAVDLTFLAFGAGFGGIAWTLAQHRHGQRSP